MSFHIHVQWQSWIRTLCSCETGSSASTTTVCLSTFLMTNLGRAIPVSVHTSLTVFPYWMYPSFTINSSDSPSLSSTVQRRREGGREGEGKEGRRRREGRSEQISVRGGGWGEEIKGRRRRGGKGEDMHVHVHVHVQCHCVYMRCKWSKDFMAYFQTITPSLFAK